MSSPAAVGKVLIMLGLAIAALGFLYYYKADLPFLGKLPGDIHWRHGNTVYMLPLGTSVVVSIVLTLFFHLLRKP